MGYSKLAVSLSFLSCDNECHRAHWTPGQEGLQYGLRGYVVLVVTMMWEGLVVVLVC